MPSATSNTTGSIRASLRVPVVSLAPATVARLGRLEGGSMVAVNVVVLAGTVSADPIERAHAVRRRGDRGRDGDTSVVACIPSAVSAGTARSRSGSKAQTSV